jgi:hypothetical protein
MKQGYTSIVDLAKELQAQMATKKDYIVPTSVLQMSITKEKRPIITGANHNMGITSYAHGQIAGRLGIPGQYYSKMLADAPDLLAENVNHWFKANPETRMLRTIGGNIRAFLSDRFRPIDYYDTVQAILPKIIESGCEIVSCALTETKLYIKAITKKIHAAVVGDVVQAGIVVSNSEVGAGALNVEPLIFKLRCLNGLIVSDSGVRKHHIGKIADESNELYKRETLMASNKALFMKVNDVVASILTESTFRKFVDGIKISADMKITRDPLKVVEDISGRFQLQEKESTGIIQHLIAGGDLSKWGLVNAITRTSQDVSDYDRATDLERFGGDLMAISEGQWVELAQNRAA